MATNLKLTPELHARIDAIVARSDLSASEVIAEALEHGRSLEWQEWVLDKIEAGVAAADRGDFATPEEVERVLNKFRSA